VKTAWVGSGVPVMATVSGGLDAAATHAWVAVLRPLLMPEFSAPCLTHRQYIHGPGRSAGLHASC